MTRSTIPTRQEALGEASDLHEVCRARPLETVEIFEPNAFYGNDRVLKLYAGLPLDYPLKAVVPHGITFQSDYVWDQERLARLPATLCYGSRRLDAAAKTKKAVLLAVAPFAYVPHLVEQGVSEPRAGTIFFPSHSTQWIHAKGDFAGMADRLVDLPEELKPVTVCVYWQDVLLGHHRPFEEKGFRVVSAGHINDPSFLFRLYFLLAQHRFAAGNECGSHMFYALVAGCGYFHLSGFAMAQSKLSEQVANTAPPASEEARRLHALFRDPAFPPSRDQVDALTQYMGLEFFQDRDDLRRTLLLAERLDRFGFGWQHKPAKLHIARPTRYERMARSLVRRARRWMPSGFKKSHDEQRT